MSAKHPLELGRRVDAVRAGGDEDGDVFRSDLRHSSKSARSISRRGCARVMSHTEIATRCPVRTSSLSGAIERSPDRAEQRRVRIRDSGRGTGSMTVTRSSGRFVVPFGSVIESGLHPGTEYHWPIHG